MFVRHYININILYLAWREFDYLLVKYNTIVFLINRDARDIAKKKKNNTNSIFKEFDIGNPTEEHSPEVYVVNAHYSHYRH